MGNSRKHDQVKATVDNSAIWSLRGTLSGSAASTSGLTGSVVKGTELNAVVTYPSGSSIAGYPGLTLPQGSVMVTFPPISRYNQVYAWDATVFPYSGALGGVTSANFNGATGPIGYTARKLFSHAISGSYVFVVTSLSGSAGVVPLDTAHPNQPPLEYEVLGYVRNTDRRT